MIGALALLPIEERRLLAKRRRQAAWARKARAANPELMRERSRLNRQKLRDRGYYKKGGKGYSNPGPNPKRLAYFRWYNANVRGRIVGDVLARFYVPHEQQETV